MARDAAQESFVRAIAAGIRAAKRLEPDVRKSWTEGFSPKLLAWLDQLVP
jgi:hypothetical protein